jgi:hypothetical protein
MATSGDMRTLDLFEVLLTPIRKRRDAGMQRTPEHLLSWGNLLAREFSTAMSPIAFRLHLLNWMQQLSAAAKP